MSFEEDSLRVIDRTEYVPARRNSMPGWAGGMSGILAVPSGTGLTGPVNCVAWARSDRSVQIP
jgi:hypothetical protein